MSGPGAKDVVRTSRTSVEHKRPFPERPPATKIRESSKITAAQACRGEPSSGPGSKAMVSRFNTSVDARENTSFLPPTTKIRLESSATAPQKLRATSRSGPRVMASVEMSSTSVDRRHPPPSKPPTTRTRPASKRTAAQPIRAESNDGPTANAAAADPSKASRTSTEFEITRPFMSVPLMPPKTKARPSAATAAQRHKLLRSGGPSVKAAGFKPKTAFVRP
mmetsp:Transcript_12734/g.42511  ORF Transcript_12734/g.42511 Transcript_12734/m.42511 type:complete len:221 (+) Transcript_12734:443-1105(+)